MLYLRLGRSSWVYMFLRKWWPTLSYDQNDFPSWIYVFSQSDQFYLEVSSFCIIWTKHIVIRQKELLACSFAVNLSFIQWAFLEHLQGYALSVMRNTNINQIDILLLDNLIIWYKFKAFHINDLNTDRKLLFCVRSWRRPWLLPLGGNGVWYIPGALLPFCQGGKLGFRHWACWWGRLWRMLHWFAIAAYNPSLGGCKEPSFVFLPVSVGVWGPVDLAQAGMSSSVSDVAAGWENVLLPAVVWIHGDDSASCISPPPWTSKPARACSSQTMAEV